MSILQALYGGTFNPVHYGHLKPIEILANLIGLQRIIIIPNKFQTYRTKPEVSSIHRKEMLELAISDNPLFDLDERELRKNSPSYTSQTLQEWRAECNNPYQPLAFIIGQDSLLNFPYWYRYESILNNSHLIVCRRPGYSLHMREDNHQRWLEQHVTKSTKDLYTRPAGNIYLAKTACFNISATTIRDRLRHGKSCEKLVPPPVLDYIIQNHLYQKNKY